MRPRGELRLSLDAALAARGDGATWRELALHTGIGWDAARRTIENMARAGDIHVVGTRCTAAGRPMLCYARRPR